MNKKVLDTIQSNITTNPDQRSYIIKLPFNTSSRALTDALKSVSSSKDPSLKSRTIYLLGADVEEGKVSHGCYVAAVSRTMIVKSLLAADSISRIWLQKVS
jgi:alanyl-tRNA synthetase